MADAIVMEQVRKTFGEKVAVRGLDLRVQEGRLYGFIGPNGAGKTTTIRMVMAIIFPDAGRLSVLGRPSAVESKDRIGYLPEERGVYRKMRVAPFLAYMARLKGMDGGAALNKRIADWLERVELGGEAKKRCEELSKGMQQKVQFIACVIHEPELLILDEPFSGLDPVNMRLMRELFFEQHRQGRTIIFSTHVMHQAQQLCDHVVMIHQGEKVLDDSLAAIRESHEPREVVLEPVDVEVSSRAVGALASVSRVERHEGDLIAHLADGADAQLALREIASAVAVRRLELRRPSLEDVFVEIVQRRGEPTPEQYQRAEEPAVAGAGAEGDGEGWR